MPGCKTMVSCPCLVTGGMGDKTISPFEELSGAPQRSGLCLFGKRVVFLEGPL